MIPTPVSARRTLALLVPLLLAPLALPAQGLTPEQVVSMRVVGSVALSPDGRQVAYTVTTPRDSAEERGPSYSELYITSTTAAQPRAVVQQPRSAAAPQWSPDGGTLAFAATLPARPGRQVYSVPAAGGEPTPLTASPRGVIAYAWSPDGRSVAYTEMVAEPTGAAERRARGDDVIVWSEQGRFVRLWVQPIGGEARVVTPENRNVVDFVWAPDGASLAVQATEELGADAELMFRQIYSVPAAGGAMTQLTQTRGKLGPMAFSPDGRQLAWLGATAMNDPLAQALFVMPASGGTPRNLLPGYEGSAVWVGWMDNSNIGFVTQESTRTVLNRVPAAGGQVTRIFGGGAEIFGSVSFDSRRQTFATAASTARHPAELFIGNVRNRSVRRHTTHNEWLSQVALGQQETIRWMGAEGLRMEGVLVRPAGFQEGRRYPLAILPHGGPEGVDLDGWITNPLYPVQVLAGRGYVVFLPNYRGSGGRGYAFTLANHRDLGGREFEDVLLGIDHLAAMGLVDPDRVGISGTSYGGYFSAWAATRHSERFRVAIPFAGLTHWTSFIYTTDIPYEMSVTHWDLWCHENVGLCWDRSPVAHLSRAQTPTLIGHGLVDERVHPEQSIELYNALRLHDVPVELVLYPREPHGLRERAHQLDYMRRITEWMDRYLMQ
jgi:dipeptidyl aminopeptidase/acylaminoacyl peptidase